MNAARFGRREASLDKRRRRLATLDPDRRRDFYSRFRAIAGLPDEWLSRRNDPPISEEQYRIVIERLLSE
ncbi:hypothetical protein D9M69_347960 [compost metagenome]